MLDFILTTTEILKLKTKRILDIEDKENSIRYFISVEKPIIHSYIFTENYEFRIIYDLTQDKGNLIITNERKKKRINDIDYTSREYIEIELDEELLRAILIALTIKDVKHLKDKVKDKEYYEILQSFIKEVEEYETSRKSK